LPLSWVFLLKEEIMSIEQQLKRQVAVKLRSAAINVLPAINTYIAKIYRQADFVESLNSGLLQAQFGLTSSRAKAATDSIIADLISNTKAEFIPGNNANILGTLRVTIRTGLSESVFTDAEYKSGQYEIPWLTWLLKKGTQVVVMDHSVDYTNSPRSRSGKALMIEDEGGVFRVDPKYAGSPGDNVISRMICSEVKAIQNSMVQEVKKQFR
jgi:hypothetical protein